MDLGHLRHTAISPRYCLFSFDSQLAYRFYRIRTSKIYVCTFMFRIHDKYGTKSTAISSQSWTGTLVFYFFLFLFCFYFTSFFSYIEIHFFYIQTLMFCLVFRTLNYLICVNFKRRGPHTYNIAYGAQSLNYSIGII